MPEVKIELKNLTKKFGDLTAVNNVNLKIREGELFSLLGPTGCGKTTLFNLISGLKKPTQGDIIMDGSYVTNVPPQNKNVGMIFQEFAIFDRMSVYENLAFGLKIKGIPDEDIKERLEKYMDIFPSITPEVLNKDTTGLAARELQEVEICRTLVQEPSLILMDEPTSKHESRARERLRTRIRKVQRDLGVTTVYVTHDQEEAMAISDRIAVMKDGNIQQVGTPLEVYNDPSNIFVASFIGSPEMNLIDCSLEEKGGKHYLVRKGLRLEVTEKVEDEAPSDITLGIRPQNIEVSTDGTGPKWIKGEILVSEELGDKDVLDFRIEGTDLDIKVASPPGLAKVGETAQVKFDVGRIHLFDQETGDRVL